MQDSSFLPDAALRHEALALLSALDAYDLAAHGVVECWPDMERYADFRARMDAVRACGEASPAVMVLTLQLVIAHYELLDTLWQNASPGLKTPRLREAMARHTAEVQALREAAQGLAAGAARA